MLGKSYAIVMCVKHILEVLIYMLLKNTKEENFFTFKVGIILFFEKKKGFNLYNTSRNI